MATPHDDPPPRPAASRYLDVAAALANDGDGPATGHLHLATQVSMGELARRMGVTRTALYRLWPTRHDFWVDLSTFLAFRKDFSQDENDLPWNRGAQSIGAIDATRPDAMESMRTTLNAVQVALFDDVWIIVRAAQLAYPEPRALSAVRATVERRRLDRLALDIGGPLQRAGLTIRPPHTIADVAAAMWCLADGVVVCNWFVPELATERVMVDDGDGPRPWGLLGYGFRAVLLGMLDLEPSSPVPAPVTHRRPDEPAALPPMRWSDRQHTVLAAATDILLEHLQADADDDQLAVLAHVTIERLARACGVSRRAVYDLWATRDALVLDLLVRLLDDDRQRQLDGLTAVIAQPGADAGDVIDHLVAPEAAAARPLLQTHLAYLPQCRRPGVHEVFRDQHQRLVGAVATTVAGTDPTPPPVADGLGAGVSAEQLATLLVALTAGGQRLSRSNPHALRYRRGPADPESTLAGAANALVAQASADRSPG